MMIGKFNRFFARHGRAAFIVILLLIGIPFIFFFGQDVDAMRRTDLTGTRVGYVDGKPMSQDEFMHHLIAYDLQGYLREGRSYDLRRTEVMRAFAPAVFTRAHLLKLAGEQQLDAVSNEEVNRRVRQFPAFQNEETRAFDLRNFNSFKLTYLPQRGITATEFDQIMREDIAIERLYNPHLEGITVNDLELRFEGLDHNTETTAQIAHYDYLSHVADLKLTDEDLKAYYEQHKDGSLKIPAKRQVTVLYIDANDFMPKVETITEDQIKAAYEERKEKDFKEHKVRASHIQISSRGDTEEVRKQKRALAEEVLEQVKAPGADFAELARKLSQDRFSAEKGGDVGFFAEGQRPWWQAAFALKKGEISGVVESSLGFHIIKKTDERDDYKPLEGYVKYQVEEKLQLAADERVLRDQALAYYEAHKATQFTEQEIHTRHILIKTGYNDDEAALAPKRQQIEQILAECKAPGADFAELAKKYSQDSSASLGGDIGWSTRYGMFSPRGLVAPYYNAALPLKDGEISDIVKSDFGFHIIKKEGQRPLTRSFDEVKGRVFYLVKQEARRNARQQARTLMHDCAVAILDDEQVLTSRGEARHAAFLRVARAFQQEKAPSLQIVDSEYFADDATAVPGVPGETAELAKTALNLTAEDGITMEAITDVEKKQDGTENFTSDFVYLACYKASQPASVPAYEAVVDAVRTAVTRERGLAAAREKARQDAEAFGKALAAGTPAEEAAAGLTLKPLAPFTASRGPTDGEWQDYAEAVSELATRTAAGRVSSVKDVEDGAVFLYVTGQKLDMSAHESQKEMYGMMYRQMLQSATIEALREKLAKDAKWELTKRWQSLIGEEQPEPAAEDAAPAAAPAS